MITYPAAFCSIPYCFFYFSPILFACFLDSTILETAFFFLRLFLLFIVLPKNNFLLAVFLSKFLRFSLFFLCLSFNYLWARKNFSLRFLHYPLR